HDAYPKTRTSRVRSGTGTPSACVPVGSQSLTYVKRCRCESIPGREKRRRSRLKRVLARKQLVADIARGRRQAEAPRLAPLGPVDFLLVTDLQGAGDLLGDEDRIVHPAARAMVLCRHLFPELDGPELELRQFLADLAAQTLPVALVQTFA